MLTADILKSAWAAVVDSGVPSEVQGIAFKATLESLRSEGTSHSSGQRPPGDPPTPDRSKLGAQRRAKATPPGANGSPTTLADVGDAQDFFAAIAHETGVDEADLRDVFHVENGAVELKVAAKDLGSNSKAKSTTIATLLAGAVFGGTSHHRLPFSEIHDVCRSKRCFDSSNASAYLKALAGFAPVGTGKGQALTPKSGWEKEFGKAVAQVLGRAPTSDG